MKFRVTLKDPDGPYDSIQDAARDSLEEIEGIDEEERESLVDGRVETLRAFANQWLKYGEYATIEFDTEAGTATLVKAKS